MNAKSRPQSPTLQDHHPVVQYWSGESIKAGRSPRNYNIHRGSSVMARREALEDARVTILQVAAGEAHTLALTVTGGVYSWGRGLFGRSGVGVFQDELIPTSIAMGIDPDVDDVDDDDYGSLASSHSSSGRVDVNTSTTSRIAAPHRCSKVSQVAAGAYHNLALTAEGSVWSWGYNAYMDGQLGREKTASQPSPVTFTYRTSAQEVRRGAALWLQGATTDERKQPKIILVGAGGMISSAIDVDGALWLWGAVPNPSEYSTARGPSHSFVVANVERPERVRGLLGIRVYRVACGNEHIVALVEGRDHADQLDCYSWGNNQFGQLGLGDLRDRAYPQVAKALAASAVGSVVDLACGAFHTAVLAVRDDHPADLVLESSNSSRGRGNQHGWWPDVDSPTPKQPHSFFRKHTPDSHLDTIRNSRVRHDIETSSNSLKSTAWSSSRVSSSRSLAHNFAQPAAGNSNSRSEGRLSVCWTFGQGEHGQLGHGTTSNSLVPAPVQGLPNEERLRTVACGLFHTAAVTETGDVWVWGMEGGLGVCPGIGPPGARAGDALSPVRVFGDSSASCHPATGAKGIACGAAHTVTISNAGKDLWAWGRGQSGVLGLGHTSDSWFPCPVLWPPVALAPWSRGRSNSSKAVSAPVAAPAAPEAFYPMGFDCRWSSHSASSRTGSRDRADVDDSVKSSPKDDIVKETTVPASIPMEKNARDEVEAIKKELAGVRRYAESLHAAVYGEVEVFSHLQPEDPLYSDRNSDHSSSVDPKQQQPSSQDMSSSNGAMQKKKALQEWEHRMEAASDADLTRLDHYYRNMRVRLKEVLFQRKMDEWCRRCKSAINSSSEAPIEPPPRREPYSAASTPSMDGLPGEWAISKPGIHGDSRAGEIMQLPPPATSMAEFWTLAGRQR